MSEQLHVENAQVQEPMLTSQRWSGTPTALGGPVHLLEYERQGDRDDRVPWTDILMNVIPFVLGVVCGPVAVAIGSTVLVSVRRKMAFRPDFHAISQKNLLEDGMYFHPGAF